MSQKSDFCLREGPELYPGHSDRSSQEFLHASKGIVGR